MDYEKLSGNKVSETSGVIRQRVQAAREHQRIRFSNNGSSDIICNADMRIGEIRQFCQLQAEGGALSVSKCQSLMREVTLCSAHGGCAFYKHFLGSEFFLLPSGIHTRS